MLSLNTVGLRGWGGVLSGGLAVTGWTRHTVAMRSGQVSEEQVVTTQDAPVLPVLHTEVTVWA